MEFYAIKKRVEKKIIKSRLKYLRLKSLDLFKNLIIMVNSQCCISVLEVHLKKILKGEIFRESI